MEVKPGYKQTEVGVIPEEWEVRPVTKVTHAIFLGLTSKVDYVSSGGISLIRASDIATGRLSFLEARTISVRQHLELTKYRRAKRDNVLVSKSGSLGVCAIVDVDTEFSIYESIIVLQPTEILDPLFLLFLLRDEATQARIIGEKVGSTVGHLNLEMFRKLVVAIPSVTEQRAIATALSDVDGLLGGLDRLIAKKRDLKQAAMQQLLTGQTRLPGFYGEWEKTTLGQIGECIIGLTYKPENVVEHGLLVLRSSNVQNGRLAFDDNVHVNLQVSEHLYTRLGDILICVRNGSRALIGKCAVIDSAAVSVTFGAFMSVYRTKHWRFVLHAFQADSIQRQIRDNIGATINQITNKDMKAFRLCLPSEDEQTAIAEVLTEIDGELAALEQRREKTRALKQAMMQELLTGRIRLI